MSAVNPFSEGDWCVERPSLAASGATEAERLSLYDVLLFKQMVIPMMQKGSVARDELQLLSSAALRFCEPLDPLDLSTTIASAWTETTKIFKGLLALMHQHVDEAAEDSIIIVAPYPSRPFEKRGWERSKRTCHGAFKPNESNRRVRILSAFLHL